MITFAAEKDWRKLAHKALNGECLTQEEGLAVLESDNDEVLPILQAAFLVRKHFYGKKVKLNMIINAKSGLCPEDCGYCSQSIVSRAPIAKYPLLERRVLLEGAHRAVEWKAGTYCIVTSGRGPTERELDEVAAAVKEIKSALPLKICACLGLLREEDARKLREAGVDRYNHNLNTSSGHYAAITTTHTYDQRVETIRRAMEAGLSPCSGVIVGMGETDRDLVSMALALRELRAESIPVNFLNPIPGTPLEGKRELNPRRCLKVLALFRLICPDREIRIAGGREVNMRSLQPLGLYAANSIFVGDYLTTEGQAAEADHRMLEDLGFEIEECAPAAG